MGGLGVVFACAGMLGAGGAGWCGWRVFDERRRRERQRRRIARASAPARASGEEDEAAAGDGAPKDVGSRILDFATTITHRLSLGHGRRLIPGRSRSGGRAQERITLAGLSGAITVEGLRESRVRLAIFGCVLGAAVGFVFSPELMVLLGLVGTALGWRALPRAINGRIASRARELERSLPEMLDVIGLGMRSGLSFDRSLELYIRHFDTMLARTFSSAHRQWTHGLATREEALRAIGRSYDSPVFTRVVETVIRSLRFGSSLVESLEDLAKDARAAYRARRQEEVAKAPVKMMVPTGTLILPAMLILVLGPVLLELMGGLR